MNVVLSADLWFPSYQPPLGWPMGHHDPLVCDPTRYVVWINPGRGNDEQAPRLALHCGVVA